MVIDGVSQSSGIERIVQVEPTDSGILLVIRNRFGSAEEHRLIVPVEELVSILTEKPEGARC